MVDKYKLGNMRDLYIFLLIFFVAFIALSAIFPFTLVGGDEGIYAQGAVLVESGFVPVADYGRSPILSWAMWIFYIIFGPSIYVFRLPVIIAVAFSAGLIFLIGDALFSKRVGILAATIYALNPYTLWAGQIIKSEVMAILFILIAAFILIKALGRDKWWLFLLAGISLGLGYVERQSVAAFIFTVVCFMAFHGLSKKTSTVTQKLKSITFNYLFLFIGFIIGFLPIFLIVAYRDLSAAVRFWFGIGLNVILLSTANTVLRPRIAAVEGVFSYAVLRSWALMFVETLASQAWFLFHGFLLFLLMVVGYIFSKWRIIRRIILISITCVFLAALIFHAVLIFSIGSFRPLVFLFLAILSVIFLVITFYYSFFALDYKIFIERHFPSALFVSLWMVGLLIVYSFWEPGYLREFIPPIALATSFVFSILPWREMRKIVLVIFVAVTIGLYGVGVAWFQNPKTGGWRWSQDAINAATLFIAENTEQDETVFTANPLPVLIAGRAVFANLQPYTVANADLNISTHQGTAPQSELYKVLSSNPPKYALVDTRMRSHIFMRYPVFEDFVNKHYKLEITFGEGKGRIEIWKKIL